MFRVVGSDMWTCTICKTESDFKNNHCSTCRIPKDSTEHLVVANNEPNAEDQLPLSIGDVITVFIKKGDTWRGKFGTQDGWFPKTCVDDKIIKREKYRVIKSVNDARTGHLKLIEGNEVIVFNTSSNNEVWVVSGRKGGWFPKSHLEKKALPQIAPKPIKQPQESGKGSKQETLQSSNHLKKCNVLYDYAEEDIVIQGGDIVTVVITGVEKKEWLLAQIGHDKGFIPANYVQLLKNQDDDIRYVTALWPGKEVGNLTLQIGDIVKVVNRRNSGWVWVIKNETEGWYPENYLQQIDDSSEIEEPTTKPPIVPKRQKVVQVSTTIGTKDITTNMYGNTDVHVDEITSEQPPTPVCSPNISTLKMRFEPGDQPQKTFGNTICQRNEPTIKPHILPKQQKVVQASTLIETNDLTTNIYGNTGFHIEESEVVQASTTIGTKYITTNMYGNTDVHLDETNSESPPTPVRRQNISTSEMRIEPCDLPQSTYGNTTCQNNEMNSEPPPTPVRRQNISTSEMRIEPGDLPQSTYGNTTCQNNEPTTKPPILHKRRKVVQAPTTIETLDRTKNTNGNIDNINGVKTESLVVKDYEEPRPSCRTNDTDEDKLVSSSPIYDCIQEKYETYTKHVVKDKYETAESLTTESSDKPALPKRPPPPSRLPRPQSEVLEKPQILTNENIQQIASSYGKRDKNEIRFVMVGRTGSGKSATGNTIMAKPDHFESRLAGGSVTRECKRGECIQAGRKIVLVDTPGLFDTQVSSEQTSTEIIRCVNMSTPGPHAFLLVIQIARFTDEEIETFNRLFDLFGDGMGKFAIITFTKLDDLEREKTTIEKYIEMAPQKLKDFLNRCQGRYIAIDNKAPEKKKVAKVNNLIQLVDAIVNKNGGICYTNQMYKEAEAALQRKINEVEEEKAREKKKEIDRIQSKFTSQIDSVKKDNKKLAKEVSSNQVAQRQFQREKEKAKQETIRMKEELKKIDKKRHEEIYLNKKKEKEEKEKLARDLEHQERQHFQLLQNMQQQQAETNRRYLDMEQQKELQLLKVTEDNKKRTEAEIQRIIDGNDEKYKHMMQALEAKDKGYEKLQEIMREKEKEFMKQHDESRKRMELEKDKSNESLRNQLDEQKKSMDATREMFLQEQKERDQRQREEYKELQRKFERTQEQMKSKGCKQS